MELPWLNKGLSISLHAFLSPVRKRVREPRGLTFPLLEPCTPFCRLFRSGSRLFVLIPLQNIPQCDNSGGLCLLNSSTRWLDSGLKEVHIRKWLRELLWCSDLKSGCNNEVGRDRGPISDRTQTPYLIVVTNPASLFNTWGFLWWCSETFPSLPGCLMWSWRSQSRGWCCGHVRRPPDQTPK